MTLPRQDPTDPMNMVTDQFSRQCNQVSSVQLVSIVSFINRCLINRSMEGVISEYGRVCLEGNVNVWIMIGVLLHLEDGVGRWKVCSLKLGDRRRKEKKKWKRNDRKIGIYTVWVLDGVSMKRGNFVIWRWC